MPDPPPSQDFGSPPGGEDPRQMITPYAFEVADPLMGVPLATPWRRGVAMLVDLAVVGALALLREITGPLFLLAIAWFAFRATTGRARHPVRKTLPRLSLRVAAVVLFLVGAAQGIDRIVDGGGSRGRQATGEGAARVESGGATSRALAGLDSVPGEAEPAEAKAAEGGIGGATRADSLARAWATALEAGDSAAAADAREEMTGGLAADSVASLERSVSALVAALQRMEDRLEEEREPPGPLSYLKGLATDLGLGFGWLGLYFTAFLALWKGRTPGKRLVGVRVLKVNGEPLGWWDAFSRFGGYAASTVTGLVGFLQILWDANRQGLHDRIAGTVVVQGEAPSPGDAGPPRDGE